MEPGALSKKVHQPVTPPPLALVPSAKGIAFHVAPLVSLIVIDDELALFVLPCPANMTTSDLAGGENAPVVALAACPVRSVSAGDDASICRYVATDTYLK